MWPPSRQWLHLLPFHISSLSLSSDQAEQALIPFSCPSLLTLHSEFHWNAIEIIFIGEDNKQHSPQPPRMPLSPPALWSRGPSPGSPCESSGATDEQTHSQNTEQILHKYERWDNVFALQSLTHVRLTCSIMCLTFLCWLFSMSSRWWIFSLRIATSFSNCSALKVQTEL